jgi:hypothetical protein
MACVLLVSLCLVLPGALPAFALDLRNPRYQLQKRRNAQGQVDRKEGIEPVKYAGERVDLVSAVLNVPELATRQTGETYRLGFFLPQAERRVYIEVRDYDRFKRENFHYWMLPTQRQYERGFREFAWDASLAQELGIYLPDVGAVAWVGGYGYYVVAPLLLQAASFPPRIHAQGCRFVFLPNATMTVDYHVAPKSAPSPVVLQSTGERWEKDHKQIITWRGQDAHGRPAPAGHYVLKVTAKVVPVRGRPQRTIPFDVAFYYQSDIDKR